MTQEGETSLEGGSYDVLRRRLLDQATELSQKAEALNVRRKAVFGGQELALLSSSRVRTENNCTPRDVVAIGGMLLFGFQVFLGLKAETQVKDILCLQQLVQTGSELELQDQAMEGKGAFLADAQFQKELRDLFKYTKDARLAQLRRTETRLFALVWIGPGPRDYKTFRWAIDAAGRVTYVDVRGDEDDKRPAPYDFAWKQTGRDDHVAGKHPHVNILDKIFVETVGGDLTVKIENNTATGQGIYAEPVEDPNQSLDDGDIAFAQLGALILLRIKPFREDAYRYLVFNARTERVVRMDALGLGCRSLPEEQGIVFPGGYMLQTGETKTFDGDVAEMELERVLPSPNGEDVLYVFYRHGDGQYLLMPYNVIRKEVATPIRCNGYSLLSDGTMVAFREAAGAEPTRVHPVQIWRTPFTTAEYAASAPTDGSYIARVGNADLVRGISDALSLKRLASIEEPTRRTFEDVVKGAGRVADAYHWLGHADVGDLLSTLREMRKTAELVIDEFEKVIAIRKRAAEALAGAQRAQATLLDTIVPADMTAIDAFLVGLTSLRRQRGVLITLRDQRGIDLPAVDVLETAVKERFDEVSRACVTFLLGDAAFAPLVARLGGLVDKIDAAPKVSDLAPLAKELDDAKEGLTLLSEVVNGLAIDDATARTKILEGVSATFAVQNRARAALDGRKKDLGLREGRAEFGAQFKLLGQAVTGAIGVCDTPERCDQEVARLLLALEELEGRFGQIDDFLGELTAKRQEIADAFSARKQTLLAERQKRAASVLSAVTRILSSVGKKAKELATADELNAYFASDPMVQKAGELVAQLAALGDTVRADELRGALLTAKKDALRALRDRADLIDETGTIKLGLHRFTVSERQLDLSLVPRDDGLALHLSGTDFYEAIVDPALESARDLWDQSLVSESADVYRAEFLAASILFDAEEGRAGLSLDALARASMQPDGMLGVVRTYAEPRLDEGYERGVHDVDATAILEKLVQLHAGAGTLRFVPDARALGCLYWAELDTARRDLLHRVGKSAGRLRDELGHGLAQVELARGLEEEVRAFAASRALGHVAVRDAARYVAEELAKPRVAFTTGDGAERLRAAMLSHLEEQGSRRALEDDLRALEAHPKERLALARAWVDGYLHVWNRQEAARFALEVAAMLVTDRKVDRVVSSAATSATLTGMLGSHARTDGRTLTLVLDELLARLGPFVRERTVRFRAYRKTRVDILAREKVRLALAEFAPRVLSSFVRNRLIDEVYLPLVGANLAKQLGAAGAQKRTDQMGLLLLVSPPGYGKTTLMEYVADKLGLIFMKVNGPALGHQVTSLDPKDAPSSTSRKEVEKINLALEMGNNVMLYLDDIQHTSAELLQKFISLCDAQRKIEGVWNGRTRTYDLRGKRFCVVMAGNPYTESGARFQIPDMLANRADTYNLGDILDGKRELFAESYLENALTSNPTLAPLTTRDPGDIRRFFSMARGDEVRLSDMVHGYSSAEAEEITAVLRHMLRVQKTLGVVNETYIASASQDDAFRTEPPFKLQGSYRNMNKIAEKVAAAMNEDELERLVDDHYAGESQTLTTGAEQNLLKLGELRGRLGDHQVARWAEIKESYQRVKRAGGPGADPVTRVTGSLSGLDVQLGKIREALLAAASASAASNAKPDAGPRIDVALTPPPSDALAALVAQQAELVSRALVPLAQATLRGGENQSHVTAMTARLTELGAAMERLEKKLAHGVAAPPRFDVTLSPTSGANFYVGVGGTDVVKDGGLFVTTYGKLPALGSAVALHVAFPGGTKADLHGVVVFTQDYAEHEADTVEGGFGAQLVDVPSDVHALIAEYARHREPLLRDT